MICSAISVTSFGGMSSQGKAWAEAERRVSALTTHVISNDQERRRAPPASQYNIRNRFIASPNSNKGIGVTDAAAAAATD